MPSNGSQLEPRPVTVALGKGKVDFRVRPGLLRVAAVYGEGPFFRLVNHTGFPITAEFPEGLVLGARGERRDSVSLDLDGTEDLQVNPDYGPSTPSVTLEYDVHVHVNQSLKLDAVGGSRPEIEIRR
jgi:hypothetical protein